MTKFKIFYLFCLALIEKIIYQIQNLYYKKNKYTRLNSFCIKKPYPPKPFTFSVHIPINKNNKIKDYFTLNYNKIDFSNGIKKNFAISYAG